MHANIAGIYDAEKVVLYRDIMVERVYNFCAGPGAVPLEVLKEIDRELLDYRGQGLSILEVSHRSEVFEEIYDETRLLIRELLQVPDEFDILLLQGGASLQFYMAPLNLAIEGCTVDVIHTGFWSGKAISDIKCVSPCRIVASSEDSGFMHIPDVDPYEFNPDSPYVYLTSNNTIYGTQWHQFPDTGSVPIVADMTSDIFSKPLDFSKFGVVFASAQKNMGVSGVTMVIVRRDLAERCPQNVGAMMQYRTHINRDTVYNTAPVFSIYATLQVLRWMKRQGGIPALQKVNAEKARRLYEVVDQHDLYISKVNVEDRSEMNICFHLKGGKEAQFVEEAKGCGIIGVNGHREAGGIRVSLYNPVALEAVDALVDFMSRFAASQSTSQSR